MQDDEKSGVECSWAPPPGAKLEELLVVPAKARCFTCFVEATVNVSVRAPKAGQAQALARKALERALRGLGCAHDVPQDIAGRARLPKSWFP